ncbi:MAG TPA: AAA family ATPase [Candidatus Kapabacteria bacterium]|nr:AAA family ATPase [Candidatus Kapabacteria bacterium]
MLTIPKYEPMTEIETASLLNNGTIEPEKFFKNLNPNFSNFLETSKGKEPMKQIFGNFLFTNELLVIAGKTNVGKTIFSYQIADGISKGNKILDLTNEAGALKVAYFDFEMNYSQILKRFPNYQPNDNFLRPDIDELMKLTDYNFNFDIVENFVKEFNVQVVIIDNLTSIGLQAKNEIEQMQELVSRAKRLKDELNISIILLHHTTKIKENRELTIYDIYGSSKLVNAIDNCLIINQSNTNINYRYLKQVKARNSPINEKVMVLELNQENYLHFDFIDFDLEKNHLLIDTAQREKRINELTQIAKEIFTNENEMYYSDCVNKYVSATGKSIANGKKVISAMTNENLLLKLENNKYTINRNEIPF